MNTNKIFNMKTIYTIILLLVVIPFSKMYAQDVIVLKSGDEISAVVNEIGIDVIKYKKFDNQTGPIYNVEKSQVFMIKYQNGTKDVFNQVQEKQVPENKVAQNKVAEVAPQLDIPPPPPQVLSYSLGVKLNGNRLQDQQVRDLYVNHNEALQLYNKGAGLQTFAGVCSWLEIGMLLLTAYASNNVPEGSSKQIVTIRGLSIIGAMMVVGVSCNITGHSKKRQSVERYNADILK